MERLKGIYTDLGVSIDLFHAVAEIEPNNLADFDQRIKAMQEFMNMPEADSLSAANKRIRNILKKSDVQLTTNPDPSIYEDEAEKLLSSRIEELAPKAKPMFERGEYTQGLKMLASLKEPIDLFFEQVMVMSEDTGLRTNRLKLLNQLESLFLSVADFSRIQVKDVKS
jgi:glycyl-tRNA synthetase beta chain